MVIWITTPLKRSFDDFFPPQLPRPPTVRFKKEKDPKGGGWVPLDKSGGKEKLDFRSNTQHTYLWVRFSYAPSSFLLILSIPAPSILPRPFITIPAPSQSEQHAFLGSLNKRQHRPQHERAPQTPSAQAYTGSTRQTPSYLSRPAESRP